MVSGWNADGNSNGDHEGAAWLFLGPGPVGHDASLSVSDASIVFSGNVDGDRLGYQVANLGDIDGKGVPDIGISGTLIGDHTDETLTANGAVYIFLGETLQAALPSSGTTSLDPDDADVWIYGEAISKLIVVGLEGSRRSRCRWLG